LFFSAVNAQQIITMYINKTATVWFIMTILLCWILLQTEPQVSFGY